MAGGDLIPVDFYELLVRFAPWDIVERICRMRSASTKRSGWRVLFIVVIDGALEVLNSRAMAGLRPYVWVGAAREPRAEVALKSAPGGQAPDSGPQRHYAQRIRAFRPWTLGLDGI